MDTLVLSAWYEPMARISWQRAISLLFAGKVEVVDEYQDREIRSTHVSFKMPAVVRFLRALRHRTVPAPGTRRALQRNRHRQRGAGRQLQGPLWQGTLRAHAGGRPPGGNRPRRTTLAGPVGQCRLPCRQTLSTRPKWWSAGPDRLDQATPGMPRRCAVWPTLTFRIRQNPCIPAQVRTRELAQYSNGLPSAPARNALPVKRTCSMG